MAGKYRFGRIKTKKKGSGVTLGGAGSYKANRYKKPKILEILRAKSKKQKNAIFAAWSPKGSLIATMRKGRMVSGKTSRKAAALLRKKLGIRRRKTSKKKKTSKKGGKRPKSAKKTSKRGKKKGKKKTSKR